MAQPDPPSVLFVIGPPAVGKMTVGEEIARLTGFKLLHNHLTIEPVLALFPFGSPPFNRLVGEFRRRLVAEAAASDLPGLILTFVAAHDQDEDRAALFTTHARPFRERGGRVLCLELEADQQERLRRNSCPSRLAAKPSKRDVESSRRRLLAMDAAHRLTSLPGELDEHADAYLRIDNTRREPADVAAQVVAHFGLADTGDDGLRPAAASRSTA